VVLLIGAVAARARLGAVDDAPSILRNAQP
jgi:hypothetical protein